MTGKLTIDLTSGTEGLEVIETASAGTLSVAGSNVTVSSSGSTIWNRLQRNVDFVMGSVGSAALFFLDASASRIGIGTSSPDATLDLENGALRLTNSTDGVAFEFAYDPSPEYWYFDQFGSDRHFIIMRNTGNIGVGDPAKAKLSVFGTMSGFSLVIDSNVSNGSGRVIQYGPKGGKTCYSDTDGAGFTVMECNNGACTPRTARGNECRQ
jgi:hypothetical protein